jgi:transposase
MNRTDNQTRKIFQRMHKAGLSAVEIAKLIGKSRQTVYNLKKLDEDKLLLEPDKNTRKPTFDLDALNTHFMDNKFDFNYEVAAVFKKGKSTIHRWRHKLGFNRKKAKTTYKEADDELKKTSNQI